MATRGQPMRVAQTCLCLLIVLFFSIACGQETSFVENTSPNLTSERSAEQLSPETLDAMAAGKNSFGENGPGPGDDESGGDGNVGADGEDAGDADGGADEGNTGLGGDGSGDGSGADTAGDATGGDGSTGSTGTDTGTDMGGDTSTGGDTTGTDTGGGTSMGGDTTGTDTGGDTGGGTGGTDGGMDGGSSTGEDPLAWQNVTLDLVQPSPGDVDILWIVDSSGSMSEEQSYLGNNFQSFISELVNIGVNFQTAVTSTDVCQDTIPPELENRACPVDYGGSAATHHRGTFIGANGAQILSQGQPDIQDKFLEYTSVGVNGSGFEHGLYAAKLAIEKSLSGGNPEFMRPDGFLAIIVVSDEEDDGIGLGMVDAYNGINFVSQGYTTFAYTHEDLTDYLTTVKGAGKFSVSAITGTRDANGNLCTSNHSNPLEEGTQYINAAQSTGGIVQSICETNWSSSLSQIGADLSAQITQIALQGNPDPSSIVIKVNGTETSEWSYISGTKTVKFNTGAVPDPGANITVEYRTLLP